MSLKYEPASEPLHISVKQFYWYRYPVQGYLAHTNPLPIALYSKTIRVIWWS